MWLLRLSICVLVLSGAVTNAAHTLGNPKAPKGGTFTVGFPGYPKALLLYLASEELSSVLNSLTFDSLLDNDPETNEFLPLLAEKWEVSADKKVFTFKLNPNAKFSDGTPVTAEDVKFTWDTILNPKHKTIPFQVTYASIESCTVVDPLTIQFKAKTLHFKNLEKLGSLIILPKHFYSKGDFNKDFNNQMLGSGPYTLDSVKLNDRITLKRNEKYWAAGLTQNIGRYNFDRVVFRSIADYDVQFEVFKKGEIDYFYFLSAKMWATQTDVPQFKKGYIKKLKAETASPTGTQGVVWNMRKPLFQDARVRWALSHLMNRERWIKDLFYNNYQLTTGVIGVNSEYYPPGLKPVPYDPKKARELLKAAGWTEVGSDGVLKKGDLRFEFEMLSDSPAHGRYLTLYQEDLKKVGIKMNIRIVDWATGLKLMDDRQFDATLRNQGRETEPSDFGDVWGTAQADIKGSGNACGYKNAEVDQLAKEIDETFDKKKRIPLVRKLAEIISKDQPMSFAWEPTYTRLAYWNRFSFPGKGYFRFSSWRTVFHFWWLDTEKSKKLDAAMGNGSAFSQP